MPSPGPRPIRAAHRAPRRSEHRITRRPQARWSAGRRFEELRASPRLPRDGPTSGPWRRVCASRPRRSRRSGAADASGSAPGARTPCGRSARRSPLRLHGRGQVGHRRRAWTTAWPLPSIAVRPAAATRVPRRSADSCRCMPGRIAASPLGRDATERGTHRNATDERARSFMVRIGGSRHDERRVTEGRRPCLLRRVLGLVHLWRAGGLVVSAQHPGGGDPKSRSQNLAHHRMDG